MNLNDTTTRFLTKLYDNATTAEVAYNLLLSKNYSKDNITVVMSDTTRSKYFANSDLPDNSLGSKAVEGVGIGGTIGATVGALAAAAMAVGTVLAIPGLGLVIAGPIAAGLAGAGAGSTVGGLLGALIGAGVPDEHAKLYEDEIKAGKILLGVQVPATEYDLLNDNLASLTL